MEKQHRLSVDGTFAKHRHGDHFNARYNNNNNNNIL